MISRGSVALAQALKPAMSGAELARALGVSRAAVSGWVTGEFQPTPATMARIEELLGVPMRAWTEDPPEPSGKDDAA